ncbi:peptidoglycan-associated lipoprotein Pal [Rhodanobacter aciditrophus]|jgi:peptidoglycan-associated lipoprotein|uniref:Peptidoglycan-associated lipoprotein n=1 Tax=Rhodanobacter aciditrophus TaxID=1623218 RepID=A0ABW4B468_9GAMM
MSVSKLGKFAVVGLSAAWLAGCSTTATESDNAAMAEEGTGTEAADTMAESDDATYGAGENGGVSSVIVEDDAAMAADMQDVDPLEGVATVFYFDFDKSIVRPAAREALAKHAEFLINNPDARIVLEGHADERGTREYNMALGERRAKAVLRYLTIQGVAASQIETVSFGEEVPVSFGHDDDSWQLNRRVEVRYE